MALLLLPQILLGGNASSISGSPRTFSEIFVLRSMRQIHSAQATYQATFGNGNFGSLQNLYQAAFIDEALASGSKYGYSYIVTVTPLIPGTTPSGFKVTATPRAYRKTGLRSFYIDVFGEIRGGDRNGQSATANDPFIDDCTNGSIVDNERCTTQSLRTLHGAEFTYQATSGNGNFASLTQLGNAWLISRTLATGLIHGYSFTVTFVTQTSTVPATFRITAVPQTYGTTGTRSFFIATDGVIYCADKNGATADENDPPCNQ